MPRPFWLCVPGIQGGRKWFDRLLSTFSGIQGQRKVKCVYRDFAAPGNSHDPRRATKAMLSPLTGVKLQRAVQVMLMEACDLSAEEGFKKQHASLCTPVNTFCLTAAQPHTSLPRAQWSVVGGQRVQLKCTI